MALSRLAARLYGAPLLITPEKAKILEEVFRAHLLGTAPKVRAMDDGYAGESEEQRALRVHQERCQRYAGIALQRRDDKPYALTQSGIALIPAMGTLIQRGSWMDSVSGLTSYDMLASLLDKSAGDPDVRGILFEFDTPGGEVPGAFELQARIAAASARKPLWAHANEMALSAGYLLASGAERLYVAQTGAVGSVGVVMLHVDQSKRDSQMGYAYTFIYAGDRKIDANSHAPLSPRAKSWAQGEVDRTYAMFVDAVAKGRGVEAAAVRATEAGILNPEQARAADFVDDVATLSQTVGLLEAELLSPGSTSYTGTRMAADGSTQQNNPEVHMKAASPAATLILAALGIAMESVSEANGAKLEAAIVQGGESGRTQARAEGVKEGETQGTAAGVKAERERVKGVLSHAEAKERIGLAMSVAFETDMSVDQAAKLLASAPKQAGSSALAALMADVKNPKIGASDGLDQPAAQHRMSSTAEVYARFNQRPESQ